MSGKKKGPVLEFFSPAKIALIREVKNHPDLVELLATEQPEEFEDQVAMIAGYLKILVDGMYTMEELDRLCDICWRQLVAKRKIILH